MAVTRDQTARIVRAEPDEAAADKTRDAGIALAETLRAHVADESKRRPIETPERRGARRGEGKPAPPAPAAPAAQTSPAAPKAGKRKFVLLCFLALLALAVASYGVYYVLVGRFYISTDDAYVRANNTMLGA